MQKAAVLPCCKGLLPLPASILSSFTSGLTVRYKIFKRRAPCYDAGCGPVTEYDTVLLSFQSTCFDIFSALIIRTFLYLPDRI